MYELDLISGHSTNGTESHIAHQSTKATYTNESDLSLVSGYCTTYIYPSYVLYLYYVFVYTLCVRGRTPSTQFSRVELCFAIL